jgi:hypothetical protein
MGNHFGMAHGVGMSTRGNLYLLLAGTGAMVVATFGLFVRASPILSGAFLVVGAALLVIAVFAPDNRQPKLDLPTLERADLEYETSSR